MCSKLGRKQVTSSPRLEPRCPGPTLLNVLSGCCYQLVEQPSSQEFRSMQIKTSHHPDSSPAHLRPQIRALTPTSSIPVFAGSPAVLGISQSPSLLHSLSLFPAHRPPINKWSHSLVICPYDHHFDIYTQRNAKRIRRTR